MAARTALRHQATHDSLTDLWHHGAIVELLNKEFARARRARRPVAAILLDIDKFKEVNDTHGHLAGDQVLREVADRLAQAARAGDSVGRYGGEEFLVVLPHDDTADADTVAERLRSIVSAAPVTFDGREIPVSISAGIGVATDTIQLDVKALIHAADTALYEAKTGGRNRICRQVAGAGKPAVVRLPGKG